jgi:alkaline phosphatase
MVEGGRIDNAGHNNDPAGSVHETLAFDAAVEVALAFAQSHPDTLLVVTADHETGGLSVRTDNSQDVLGALNQVTASAETLANLIVANRDSAESLMAAKAGFSELNAAQKMAFRTSKVASVKSIVAAMLSSRAKVSWSSTGHTGVNVPLRAFGVESSLFAGTIDNTEVPKRIAAVMGLKLD